MGKNVIVSNFLAALKILPWLVIAGVISRTLNGEIANVINSSPNAEHLSVAYYLGLVGLLGYLSYSLVGDSPIPSFVTALLVGIAVQPLLQAIDVHHDMLQEIVSVAAALILFQGGLETGIKSFRRLIWKIGLLAFPGVLVTAILLSLAILTSSLTLGIAVSATVAVLLGAILASTDPASVILLFQGMRFKDPATKDIIVSESAMNDVVGAILTLSLVGFASTVGAFPSISGGYQHLVIVSNVLVLVKQLGFGVLAGAIGFGLLRLLTHHVRSNRIEGGAQAVAFLSIILLTFYLAIVLNGSGYLAAFIAGLMFESMEHLRDAEHFFGGVIDGIAKPSIFLLLGALVNLHSLLAYAPIGILVGVLFIFIIRPAMVFGMLGVFLKFGKERLTTQQLLFFSFIRETGAIPAVLLVTVSSFNLPGSEPLVPIGMWIILLTLVLAPAVTPFVARRLELLEVSSDPRRPDPPPYR